MTNGGRYGGRWNINAFRGGVEPSEDSKLGEIFTTRPHEDPDMAFDTAVVWANSAAVHAGHGLVHSENLNGMYPSDQAPFFMLGRFAIANAEYLNSLPPAS